MLVDYGEKVGVAFQLADDVLDLVGDHADSGKTPGTDLREHVPTMPVLLLRRDVAAGTAPDGLRRAARRCSTPTSADDDRLAEAVQRLREHPVTAQAREVALGWAADAVAALAPLPDVPGEARPGGRGRGARRPVPLARPGGPAGRRPADLRAGARRG